MFQTGEGTSPIVLHLPHNSRYFPEDFSYHLTASEHMQDIHRLVDHHTDQLYQAIIDANGDTGTNPYCRMYFDLNGLLSPRKSP